MARYRGRRGLRVTRALTAAGVTLAAAAVLCAAAYLLWRPTFKWGDNGLEVTLPFWRGTLFSREVPESEEEPDIVVIRESPRGR